MLGLTRWYEKPHVRLSRWVAVTLAGAALVALGVVLARAPLTWCVLLVFGALGAFLLLRWPTLGLYGIAFSVPFGSLRELALGGVTFGASELLVLATVSAWLLRMLATRQLRVARARTLWGLLCYVAVLAIGLLPAQQLTPALKELAKWVEFALVYLLVAGELDERGQRWLVAALLVAGSLEAALGIYQFLFQVGPEGFVLFGRYMRAYGTFQQPNPFGGYLGLLLPLGYAVALTQAGPAWRAWRKRDRAPGLLWLLGLASSVVMATALVMSWSRGALVGLAAGAALALLALGRRAWVGVTVVAVLALLLAPALTGSLPGDLLERLTGSLSLSAARELGAVEVDDANFATIERLAHWQAAWRMFERQPWLGVGTGQYAVAYPEVALPRWQDPLGHAHNYYLNVLAENGLLGLAGYALFVLLALVSTWRRTRCAWGWQRTLAVAALGTLGHLLVHSLVDNLYVHEMYLLVAVVLGLATRPAAGSPMKVKHEIA